jgi:hypothetical protein
MMAIHAATVGILIEKSKFEPEVALGVAEAIDLAMTQAQFVQCRFSMRGFVR